MKAIQFFKLLGTTHLAMQWGIPEGGNAHTSAKSQLISTVYVA
jgi:hypothetical protein